VSKGGGKFLTALLNARTLPLLVELDIASQSRSTAVNHAEFAQELSAGLKANQTLSKFTFSGDYSTSKPATMETSMTVADFSGKSLGVSGGMMTLLISLCGNRARNRRVIVGDEVTARISVVTTECSHHHR
jgi:hypothetical protein